MGFQVGPEWAPKVFQPRPSYWSLSSPIRKLWGWEGGLDE